MTTAKGAVRRADALGDMLGSASKTVDTMAKDATGESGGVSRCDLTDRLHDLMRELALGPSVSS